MSSKVLFSDPTGPLIEYQHGFLTVEDLNPQISTRWRMSRWEMVKLGFRALRAAASPRA